MRWIHQDATYGVLVRPKDIRVWIKGNVVPVQFCDFDFFGMEATQGHDVSADEASVEERGNSLLRL